MHTSRNITRFASRSLLRMAFSVLLLSSAVLTGCDALDPNADAATDAYSDAQVADARRDGSVIFAHLVGDWRLRSREASTTQLSFHGDGTGALRIDCARYAFHVHLDGQQIQFGRFQMEERFCEAFAPDPTLAALPEATHYRITDNGTLKIFSGEHVLKFDRVAQADEDDSLAEGYETSDEGTEGGDRDTADADDASTQPLDDGRGDSDSDVPPDTDDPDAEPVEEEEEENNDPPLDNGRGDSGR